MRKKLVVVWFLWGVGFNVIYDWITGRLGSPTINWLGGSMILLLLAVFSNKERSIYMMTSRVLFILEQWRQQHGTRTQTIEKKNLTNATTI